MKYLRLVIALVAVGAGAAATHWFLRSGDVARREREKRELSLAIERLTQQRRVADVIIHAQEQDAKGQIARTDFEFIEMDANGHALAGKRFSLPGRVLYFVGLVIKFDEARVAAGDPLRGHNIMLFRRIFSESCSPKDGPSIDGESDVPSVFRVNPNPGEVERRLWKRFWSYVTDPKLAKEDGVRIAQGEAVYAPVTAGQRWTLTLENSGGLNLKLIQPAQ